MSKRPGGTPIRTLFAALCAFWAVACAPSAPASVAAGAEPAIWRIADADSEIWLFGTAHILPSELSWRGPRFEQAFGAADELVLETDIESDPAGFAALVNRYGSLPAGQTLDARLPANERAQLARVAPRVGIDARALQTQRPWRAALVLSNLYAMSRGQSQESGVEAYLSREANRRGLRRSYLETVEQQVRVLADLPAAEEERFLSSTLQEIEDQEDTFEETDRAWSRGDVRALTRLFEEDIRDAGPVVYAALITRRNAAWVEEIQRRLHGSGHTFIAVGAAHLVGRDSVVSMLRARGVRVEGP